MSTGQNGWFFHVDATTTPLALSRFIFCSTLGRTLKGGKQYTEKSPQCTEKQSIMCACGSAVYDAYSANCVFILEANRSVVGCASKMVSVSRRSAWSSFHSVSACISRDSLSASTFSMPVMCAALIHMPFLSHHCQISWAKSFKSYDFKPCLFKQLTVVVLPVTSLICVSLLFKSDSSLRKMAKSSR